MLHTTHHLSFTIGHEYRPDVWLPKGTHRPKWKLKEVRGFIFEFECGHWCTDTVFINMFDITEGKPVEELSAQLQLF